MNYLMDGDGQNGNLHVEELLGGTYTTYRCGRCCHWCSALAVQPSRSIGIRHNNSSTRRYKIGHKIVIIIFFSSFNGKYPSHSILVDCCMHYWWGWGPMAAIGWRHWSWSIDAMIRIVEKSSPPAPFPPSLAPPLPHTMRSWCPLPEDMVEWWIRQIGFRADDLDVDDDAHCYLPRYHRQFSSTFLPTYSYIEKEKHNQQLPKDNIDGQCTDDNIITGNGDLHDPCLADLAITIVHRSLHLMMVCQPFPKPRQLIVSITIW